MASDQFSKKSVRSHSIHVAIGRDYQRIQTTRKLNLKLEQEYLNLERKLNSHAKWNERADHRNARKNSCANGMNSQERSPITLEEFLTREKIKQDNISHARDVANQNIRPNPKTLLFPIDHKTR